MPDPSWQVLIALEARRGEMQMKKICAILIILPIAGGCDSRKSDLESCRIEAVRAYPDAKTSELKDYSDFVTKCMQAKGYEVKVPDRQ